MVYIPAFRSVESSSRTFFALHCLHSSWYSFSVHCLYFLMFKISNVSPFCGKKGRNQAVLPPPSPPPRGGKKSACALREAREEAAGAILADLHNVLRQTGIYCTCRLQITSWRIKSLEHKVCAKVLRWGLPLGLIMIIVSLGFLWKNGSKWSSLFATKFSDSCDNC